MQERMKTDEVLRKRKEIEKWNISDNKVRWSTNQWKRGVGKWRKAVQGMWRDG